MAHVRVDDSNYPVIRLDQNHAARRTMKRNIALTLLNCAAALVALGGCFDMLIPAVPANLLDDLQIAKADASPHLSSLKA